MLSERIEFEGGVPPIVLKDAFVSDSGLPQQVAIDAVVPLGFILGTGFNTLHIKNMSFELKPVESKHQLYISQAWTSAHEVHPGDPVQITTLLAGENGVQMTRSATYLRAGRRTCGPTQFHGQRREYLEFPGLCGNECEFCAEPRSAG